MSERSRPSVFWVLASLILPVMAVGTRYTITGGSKLPAAGSCIIAPNHHSEIDPIIVGTVLWKLGREPRFLAKASLFRVPIVGWFLRRSGQVPVERVPRERGKEPLKAAQRLVDNGQLVVIYPEGSLTRDPELWPMRGKTGAVRMALEHGIPIIPIAHWGAQRVMARYSKKISLFPRHPIRVMIGDPVDLSAFRGSNLDAATLNAATVVVMENITRLLEDLRGETAPAERWNPSQHSQNETGRIEP